MLLQCRGKVHFFAHTLGVVRMELYVDLSFKQRTNSEFIVSEKKTATNIHKRAKMYTL
jgi:hypothetical protein